MSDWETIDLHDTEWVENFLQSQSDRIKELEKNWTAKEISEVINDTNEYIMSNFYEKMTYGEVASLNMFVMLLNENFKEKQMEKENG